MNTKTLYRPVGPVELARIRELHNLAFPPRLPEQPYFQPLCELAYAEDIAREWNTRAGGIGFVTRFDVDERFLSKFDIVKIASGQHEYWIPSEQLEQLNRALVGSIRVIRRFQKDRENAWLSAG